jgi:hypothetical protein
MRNKVIALITALGLAFAVATPAKAWYYGGPWGGGYYGGGWGYGGYGAAMGIGMGAALLGGVIGGAIASQNYGYGYGYAPAYAAPVYAYPQAPVRKQVIIKNSPGARVYEEDDFGW